MKKIMAVFMAMFMLVSVTAYGADLSFLAEPYKNYASEGTFKIKFDKNGEFEKLLDELGAAEEGGEVIDLIPFIKSLLSLDGSGKTQINMSDDYKKLEAGITFNTSQYVSVNPNLNADVKTKSEVWIKMDLSDSENPVYNVVVASPFMKKYMVINLFELIDESEKDEFISAMDMTLNEEFINGQNEFIIKTIEKNATVKTDGSKCVITIDNDALISIIKDVFMYSVDVVKKGYITESQAEELEELQDMFSDIDLSEFKLLGNKGIVITYGLKNGKMSSVDISADISINFAEIYSRLSGIEWEYASEGLLEFDVEISGKITTLKTVDVDFPEITEENSILLHEMYDEYEYEEEYPRYGVYAECDYLPVIDNETYVPLRQTLEEAYADTVLITYEKGVITLESENFKDFKSLYLKVGSDKAVSDTGEYTIKPLIVDDGVSYVAASFFTDVFGWEYGEATHDVLAKKYYYDFYTYDDEYDDHAKYPYYVVSGESGTNPVIGEDIYVPLRTTLVDAYAENVSINFEKGLIKLESEFFPGFKTITLKNGSDKAYTENSEYSIGNVYIKDGTTYVSKKLFEEVLGWELTSLMYYIEGNKWNYTFVTE